MKGSTIKDIMNTNVVTVNAKMKISELVSLLNKEAITGVPVINGRGALAGVVSLNDVARNSRRRAQVAAQKVHNHYYTEAWDQVSPDELDGFHIEVDDGMCVGDIMTPLVVKISQDITVKEAAAIMLRLRVHRLIVTSEERVVGIVTTTDILRAVSLDG